MENHRKKQLSPFRKLFLLRYRKGKYFSAGGYRQFHKHPSAKSVFSSEFAKIKMQDRNAAFYVDNFMALPVKIKGLEALNLKDIKSKLKFFKLHGKNELEKIFQEVMSDKPEVFRAKIKFSEKYGEFDKILRTWCQTTGWEDDEGKTSHTGGYEYQDSKEGFRKLIKDAFKFHLYEEHSWVTIGAAQYMTGDATGLALATLADDEVTLKILKGQQFTNDQKNLSFYVNNELPEIFNLPKKRGQIKETIIKNGSKYIGTSDLYARRYNPHTKKAEVKPWNYETWLATLIVGQNYPDFKNEIKKNLLPSTEKDQEQMLKIKKYKEAKLDPVIDGKKTLFLWGRTSGAGGGAHKELDSDKGMMLQLVKSLTENNPESKLIIVGDEVIKTREDLSLIDEKYQANVFILNRFWKDVEYGEYFYNDRNAQRYLFDLFPDDTVHIGMRSGSLEGLALLDKNVIFIDDMGNNAQERMEFWTGNGAYERKKFMGSKVSEDEKNAYEKSKSGPVKNYKRVGSYQKLGEEISKRTNKLTAIKGQIEVLMTGRDSFGEEIIDHGNKKKEKINVLKNKEYSKLLEEGVPDKNDIFSRLIDEFKKEIDRLCDKTNNVKIWGKEKVETGSKFYFNREELESIRSQLETSDIAEDIKNEAIKNINTLFEIIDCKDNPLVGEGETSDPGKSLLGDLLKGDISKAGNFINNFNKMKKGFRGKSNPAKKGTMMIDSNDIDSLNSIIEFMEKNNSLLENELEQINFLIKYLSEPF